MKVTAVENWNGVKISFDYILIVGIRIEYLSIHRLQLGWYKIDSQQKKIPNIIRNIHRTIEVLTL